MKKYILLTSFLILIFKGNLHSQVYINRNIPLNSTETFGITKQLSASPLVSKFGGMYIETKGSIHGKPYVGYALDGLSKAYHYYNGTDDGWHLYNDRLNMSVWPDSMQWSISNDIKLFYDGHRLEFGQNGNTFLGKGVTDSNNSTNIANTVMGWLTGRNMTGGVSNTLLGFRNGENLTTGDYNTIVGSEAGNIISSGSRNTLLGYRAGRNGNATNSGNIFIGYRAGDGMNVSNKLIIANSETTSPLIEGNFNNANLTINGDTDLNGNNTIDGNSTITGQLGVLGASFLKEVNTEDIIIDDSNPYLEFKQLGSSKYYFQYQASNDQFILVEDGVGTVLKIKNGQLYLPSMSFLSGQNLQIEPGTGKIIPEEIILPTVFHYYGLDFHTHFEGSSLKFIPLDRDLRDGMSINKIRALIQWQNSNSVPHPVELFRIRKSSGFVETIYSLTFASGNYFREFSTVAATHIVDKVNYNYGLRTRTSYLAIKDVWVE